MDRRTLLTVLICFGIFAAWQKLYIEPRTQVAPTQQAAPSQGQPQASASNPQAVGSATISQGKERASHPPQTALLSTSFSQAKLGDGNAVIQDWNLNEFREEMAETAKNISIQAVTQQKGQIELGFEDPAFAYLPTIQGDLTQSGNNANWSYEDASVKLSRAVVSDPALPYLNVTLSAEFKSKHPSFAFVSIGAASPDKDVEERDRVLAYFTQNSVERVTVHGGFDLKEIPTPLAYAAASSRYFLLALLPQGPLEPKGLVQPLGHNYGRISLVYPISGNSISIPLKAYFGPKDLEVLRSVDGRLDHTVDFGMFTVVGYPILKLLKWLYSFVKNYGIAIILLTLLLKIVTYPLQYKSMKSMKEMAKLQPQLQKIREKHKDDKEALNREMLTVMRTHGYNPMAGCLPILIQMPVFFALYRVLYSSIELLHQPFAFWIHDLSAKDPFYITPVLLSITMFIQQKLSPNTATDPMQAKMLQFMPLIFGVFMMTVPSGLTIYMLTNALATIVTQMMLNKKFNTTGSSAALSPT